MSRKRVERKQICPICKSGDRVYHQGHDPLYKDFIMCRVHGIQVVKKVELDEHKKEMDA